MSGDKLTIFTFLAGTAVASMLGAIPTHGRASRILWGFGLFFAVLSLLYFRAQDGSPVMMTVRTLWALCPFIAVVLTMLVVVGRQPEPREARATAPERSVAQPPPEPIPEVSEPAPPILNPALTADYLNRLVEGATELEIKRKIDGLKNQLVQLKGEVRQLSEEYSGSIEADVLGLQSRTIYRQLNGVKVTFDKEHAAALEAIKPGDWIEFRGEIKSSMLTGWQITRAEFVGRAEAPPPPKKQRAPRSPSSAGKA